MTNFAEPSGTAGARRPRALSASQEDYLEAIYHLVRGQRRVARTSDIADRLGVRRSSVTGALRGLAARGLIDHSAYGTTTLTPRGRAAARGVAGRHRSLKDFLQTVLGLPPKAAERSACAMEHAAPPELQERLVALTEVLKKRPALLRTIRAGWPRRRAAS